MSHHHGGYPAQPDFATLRMECLVILERSVNDSDLSAFEQFIEQQIALEEPPVSVLRVLIEDLFERLHACNQQEHTIIQQTIETIASTSGYDSGPWFQSLPADRALLGMTRLLLPSLASTLDSLSSDRQSTLIEYLQQRQAEARALIKRRHTMQEALALLAEWSNALGIADAQRRWHPAGREHFVQNIRH